MGGLLWGGGGGGGGRLGTIINTVVSLSSAFFSLSPLPWQEVCSVFIFLLNIKLKIPHINKHNTFLFFRAAPTPYGGSQARGRIRATAAGLYYSHSNAGSKPRLEPTPRFTATLDP